MEIQPIALFHESCVFPGQALRLRDTKHQNSIVQHPIFISIALQQSAVGVRWIDPRVVEYRLKRLNSTALVATLLPDGALVLSTTTILSRTGSIVASNNLWSGAKARRDAVDGLSLLAPPLA